MEVLLARYLDYHRRIYLNKRQRYSTISVYVSTQWSEWADVKPELRAFLEGIADELEDRERRYTYIDFAAGTVRLHIPQRYETAALELGFQSSALLESTGIAAMRLRGFPPALVNVPPM